MYDTYHPNLAKYAEINNPRMLPTEKWQLQRPITNPRLQQRWRKKEDGSHLCMVFADYSTVFEFQFSVNIRPVPTSSHSRLAIEWSAKDEPRRRFLGILTLWINYLDTHFPFPNQLLMTATTPGQPVDCSAPPASWGEGKGKEGRRDGNSWEVKRRIIGWGRR